MNSPLNPYRAYVLGEIYKAVSELDNVKVSLKSALTSKQINVLTNQAFKLIDRIQMFNRILWSLEIMIKANIDNEESNKEIICNLNELKEVEKNNDIIYRLKSVRIIELVLELIEKKKHISPDEIIGLI